MSRNPEEKIRVERGAALNWSEAAIEEFSRLRDTDIEELILYLEERDSTLKDFNTSEVA